MINYDMMSGMHGGGFLTFSGVISILVVVILVLGIAALWKYLAKT